MSGKKKLGGVIVIGFSAILFHGSVTGQSTQDDDVALFRELIIKKFDADHDGSLKGSERDGAVSFLKGIDKNSDNNISNEEREEAIGELKLMPNPEVMPTPPVKKKNLPTPLKKAPDPVVVPIPLRHMPDPAVAAIPLRSMPDPAVAPIPLRDMPSPKLIPDPTAIPRPLVYPPNNLRLKSFYDGQTIIAIAADGAHCALPLGSVLYVPEKLDELIVKKPVGDLMIWPEFLKKYSKLVTTREVTWKTAKGEDPIKEEERRAFVKEEKIVVAVFDKRPIPVVKPASEEK